jgi:triacylglycerol lipase
MGTRLDLAQGILNGLLGDHLARTGNGLATGLSLIDGGVPIEPAKLKVGSQRAVLLVHGLMGTETAWAFPDGSDYASRLHRDLGFTALRLRYNSGRAIAESGAALSALLDDLIEQYPRGLEELVLLGHSMGGLVIRSACHVAASEKRRWLQVVKRIVYVGTPHRGAPMERAGRALTRVLGAIPDPYVRLIAEIAELRSGGIKDLGDADLTQADRARPRPFVGLRDPRHPVPLLPGIRHHLIAGTLWDPPLARALLGDVMVPVHSATDGSDVSRVFSGLGHLSLAHDEAVYQQIRDWLEVQ